MRRIIEFIRLTAIGGLLVIVPVAIVIYVLGELFYGLYALAEDVTAKLDIAIDDAVVMMGITAVALIAACFVTGLLVQTQVGSALKDWFARNVGNRIPMFNALASITRQFAGVGHESFAPVEIDLFGSEARALGFLIEDLPGDRCVVFIPSAPVATVGNIYVLARDKITFIDASMPDALGVITQWGVDARDLYAARAGAGPVDDSTPHGA